jgi:hypothetical protein
MQPERPTVAAVSAASLSPSLLENFAISHPFSFASVGSGPFVESEARSVVIAELQFSG